MVEDGIGRVGDPRGAQGVSRAEDVARSAGLELKATPAGLALTDGAMELVADFGRLAPRLRQDRLARELLVRAARIKGRPTQGLVALDATAGLGEDALLLAGAGFFVRLFERDEVMAALLADGLARARSDGQLAEVARRMELVAADSVDAMRSLAERGAQVDVVLLDPMFPAKRKNAATKKKLQLIQRLERPCDDEGGLLDAACGLAAHKVVVKRPTRGPHLAGQAPTYELVGKVVRYDVYVR